MQILLYNSRSSNDKGSAGHQEQVENYDTLIRVLVRTGPYNTMTTSYQ